MLNAVNELNREIEKELMLNHFDNGTRLIELLATATKLYRNFCTVSAKRSPKNNIILPNEVIELGDNIKKIESELGLNKTNETTGRTK